MRKTFEVEKLKDLCNQMLADSAKGVHQGREGIAIVLERVLMDTDNYKGFQYTDLNDPSRKRYY